MCFYMVGAPGLEPGTGRLKVCCDNHFTILPYMVPAVRLELTTSGLRVRCATNCATQGCS